MLGHKGSCLVPRGFRHVLEVVSVSGFSDFSEDQLQPVSRPAVSAVAEGWCMVPKWQPPVDGNRLRA